MASARSRLLGCATPARVLGPGAHGACGPAAHGSSTAPPAAARGARLPEAVYRRRRAAAAAAAAALVTMVMLVGRPERVPVGEANPWPPTIEVSLSADLPGVYVVQPGDTLWDIARALAPGEDPRVVVHGLAATAGGAALEPGQRIVLGELGASGAGTAEARRSQQAAQPAAGG